ncbi:MAG: phage tail protein [Spirochaetae bacterium HGW-Spirochaetae-10]|nr:MAG: phage tail protein [Spirochaetae bacterium HGW-Spirochaetae-10]
MIVFTTDADLTVQRVAARVWGDWTLWPIIVDDNRLHGTTLGANWPQALPAGLPLYIRDLPSSESVHLVAEGDSWSMLAMQYFGSERLSERLRAVNGGGVLYGRAGTRVVIPALVDARVIAKLRSL